MTKNISPKNKKVSSSTYSILIICIALFVSTAALYYRVGNYDFINYDDDKYVSQNSYIKSGFTKETVKWALTSFDEATWQPLTWLSFMIDKKIYGMNPGGFHLTNVFLHILNTLLLFFILLKSTKAPFKSGFAAALFAIHPLHVESVAWVTERKDVLSTFFGMLSILIYLGYAKHKNIYNYIFALLFFCFGLMSKPMLVTLPFLLLLMDYWPLNRIQYETALNKTNAPFFSRFNALLLEKTPFLLIALISCVITFSVQKAGGAVSALEAIPLATRILNAIVSYGAYVYKIFLPLNLAVIYPYTLEIPLWQVVSSVLLLSAVSIFSIYKAKSHPYIIVGWLWFLGSLVPVIGLVQIGAHKMADRFTYIPLIGIFIIISFGTPHLSANFKSNKRILPVLAVITLFLLSLLSFRQIGYWENSKTLFTHAVKVTRQNKVAHNNLGVALFDEKDVEKAIFHYNKALEIDPRFIYALNNMGRALYEKKDFKGATDYYKKAIDINPHFTEAQNNLAVSREKTGNFTEAYDLYKAALEKNPNNIDAYYNLGILLEKMNNIEASINHYKKALLIDPNHKDAHFNLANIYKKTGDANNAAIHYNKTIQIQPDYKEAYNNLGVLMGMQNKLDPAIRYFEKAIEIDADFADAHNNIGLTLIRKGDVSKAIFHYKEALRINPDFKNARNNLNAAKQLNIQENDIDYKINETLTDLEKNPDSYELNSRLGNFYAMKKDINKAIPYFEKAISIEPQNLSGLENIAISHAMNGNYLKAIEYIKRILSIQPDNVTASYYIASMYARLQNVPATIKWLETTFKKGFNDVAHIKNDINFKGVIQSPELIKFLDEHRQSNGT